MAVLWFVFAFFVLEGEGRITMGPTFLPLTIRRVLHTDRQLTSV